MSFVNFLNSTEILESRNRETETTHNIFRDCLVQFFFPTTFVDVVVYANNYAKHKLEFPWYTRKSIANNVAYTM